MTGEQKVQIVFLIIMLFTIIRMIMKMPNKVRIIVITLIIVFLTFNWYMLTYQEDTVNVIRNFLNVGNLRSNS